MYIARKATVKERLKCFFSKKHREKIEKQQLKIIKEMVTSGKNKPIIWV
jgi:hypothetical protein